MKNMKSINIARKFALPAAVLLVLGLCSIQQVRCSSYLDSFFMPQARLALNKLQQSLSPVIGTTTNNNNNEQAASQVTTEAAAAAVAAGAENFSTSQASNLPHSFNTNQVAATEASSSVAPPLTTSQEPGKGEFVKIELGTNSIEPVPQKPSDDPPPLLVVSSTEMATETDPTTSTAEVAEIDQVSTSEEPSKQGEGNLSPATASELPAAVEEVTASSESATAAPAATTTTTSATSVAEATTTTARPLEDSVRETELEAVAAVDASIGFGVDLFSSMSDSCYDEYGNARFCEPEFENVAFERQIEVSSECGLPPSRFCTAFLNEGGDQRRNCHICDAHNPKKRHPASYLTDMNNSNDPTCWVSAPISATPPQSTAPPNSTDEQQTTTLAGLPKLDNVTLVLNLDKKYEIVYISMQFCSLKPDSLAIHKSSDFGQTWSPYQFYSSQCGRYYNRPGTSFKPGIGRGDKPEAQCVNSTSTTSNGPGSGRIAFSPQEDRSSAGYSAVEKSIEWQEWITATNIKITLDRHHPNWILSSLHTNHQHAHAHHHHNPNPNHSPRLPRASENSLSTTNNSTTNPVAPANNQQAPAAVPPEESSSQQLTNPSDTFNYAMSDLTVGGRCKCNGHASRCILAKDNRLQCDCRHNTAGRDCERCAPFHFDRPWARATQLDANPCQPCNCNGHSRKCKFDAELYRLSGKRSGGVCFGCRDNTAGRFCHYCKEGYTRDHTKAISDKEVCKHCECHPIGSLGRVCNITTGQCPCKEGVTGLQCNRCAPGYQQSSSPTEPCIKLPENDINWQLTVDGDERSASTSEQQQQQQPAVEVQPTEPLGSDDTPPRDAQGSTKPSLSSSSEPELDSIQPVEQPIDKDDDSSDPTEAAEAMPQPTQPARKKQRPIAGNQWNQRNKLGPQYNTRYHAARNRHNQYQDPQLIDQDGPSDTLDLDELGANYNPRNLYYPQQHLATGQYYSPKSKQRFQQQHQIQHEFRTRHPQRQSAGGRYSAVMLGGAGDDEMSSIEDLNSLDEQHEAAYSPVSNSLYPDDSFNQIQAPRRIQHKVRQQQASRRQHFANYEPGSAAVANSELSCGDCQMTSRKMSMRQFCHLDFALKANILSKQVAEDWTKFEVEIQDIFKSPGSDSLLGISSSHRSSPASPNYIDSLMQTASELENGEERNRTANQSTVESAAIAQVESLQQVPTVQAGHRIKVGSTQSLWVPTEDLACKCPKLRLRSTYLLMGSVDLKENSANTLQLDRHGVALEWDSSLQKKLLRYQRRQSRGKC